jgi:AmmeMemoRadiSam system protein A
MAGALDGMAVDSKLLSYEGPFGVGYGVGQFIPKQADSARCFASGLANLIQKKMDSIRSKEDSFVHLARLSVESYIRTGKRAVKPEGLPPEMTEKRAGTFVSLHKDGNLRGCIGTISPVEPCIADEIISNAISACTRDPRFEPVEEKELDSLVYSVDVLGPYEKIESESQLDVKRYGVIVQRDSRRGLLLPNLDGVDTPAQQIEIARQKAGIGPEEEVQLYRFEVVRHF